MPNLIALTLLLIAPYSFPGVTGNPFPGLYKISEASAGLQAIDLSTMQHDILVLINAHRHETGLNPLQWNDVEADIAMQHSHNMATGKTPFGHAGLQKRMNAIARQLGSITATGENVASGQMTPRDVVDGWLKSPGHRRNIEGDFTLTGIGVARDRKGVIFYTQIFTK